MWKWAIVVALAVPAAVLACSYAPQSTVMGVLGYAQGPTGAGETVPANVASVEPRFTGPEGNGEFDTPVGPLFRVPEAFDEVPLFVGGSVARSDVDDLTAPSLPIVEDAVLVVSRGSRGTSCSDTVARLELDVTASDDMAPAHRLTYAIYTRSFPSPAPTGRPDAFLVRDGEGLWRWADPDDQGSEQWVWVRTVDQAGNVSELSEPFPVDTGSTGCSAGGQPSTSWVLALALLLVTRRHRPG